MFFNILIIFFCLIGLMILHELGHFLMAKKFGVEVEEFGIGYPPRIFGKKIKGTIYSLNLLPFGAFVKITGEEERIESSKSFSQKPIWQRSLIILGGVISFWLVAVIILSSIAFFWGLPTSIPDDLEYSGNKTEVMVIEIIDNSPSQLAGMKPGDKIMNFNKINQFQEFIKSHQGEETTITIKRGKESLNIDLTPRVSYPQDEGSIGVGLVRVANIKYPLYQAPWQGISVASKQTVAIPVILGDVLKKVFQGEEVEGVKLVGPIGIGKIMSESLTQGGVNFLMFLSMISIWLAVSNILPIPASDGGKLLFLGLEKIRGRAINQKMETKINAVSFILLLGLMLFVTIKDIIGLL
jgi:regulator of sigma E protease